MVRDTSGEKAAVRSVCVVRFFSPLLEGLKSQQMATKEISEAAMDANSRKFYLFCPPAMDLIPPCG
jgi:hypothetical protein